MHHLKNRKWVPQNCEDFSQNYVQQIAGKPAEKLRTLIDDLTLENENIHERDCINLNPATNVMNPRAEALLAKKLGSRPSLGYPGDKYEMGLEAIEKIEVIASEIAAEIFDADFAEIRVPSGAIANLYVFMASAKAGDTIIVPPPSIGGHVTHQFAGAAGLYGLDIHYAPVNIDGYTIDVDALAKLAEKLSPKLITVAGSLNLFAHPVAEIREIADKVGAYVMFDAAHSCGMVAGKVWDNPLKVGAHAMTMSTYKSLGGPPSGLIVCNDAGLAEKIDKIAHPGLTANFDVAKSASLAISLLDWREYGEEYAKTMVATAQKLASELAHRDVPVFKTSRGFTESHQFAIEAHRYGGGQTSAKRMREANILSCGIGLPIASVDNDLNGIRLGTPEIVRWGMKPEHMPDLAEFVKRSLLTNDASTLASEVSEYRRQFSTLHFIASD